MLPEDRLYFSLTLLQRLIVSAQLQQQPQVQLQYLQTAQPPNGQPSMPTKRVVHLLQKHVRRIRLSMVLDPTTDHSLLLPQKYTGGDRPDHLDLPPPPQHRTSPPQWSGGFRQILQGVTDFFHDSQFISTFLPMVFPPFLLPLNPDLSPLGNPATSRPIPDPFLPTGHPPAGPPQSSNFILGVGFFFSLPIVIDNYFPRGEGNGKDGQLSGEQSMRGFLNGCECLLKPRAAFSSCISKTSNVSGLCGHVHSPNGVFLPVLTGSSDAVQL